jgi:tetratricopeptide (TPR) repeat protein
MDNSAKRKQELWAQISTCEGEAKVEALMELGHDAFHEGNHAESLALCETASQIYEAMGAQASATCVGHVYRTIGWCLNELKRYPEAAAAAHRATEIYREINDSDLFKTLNEEGDYWYSAENWEKSYMAYKASLEDVNPDRSDELLALTYSHCGFVLGKMKRNQEALEHFLKSREGFKKLMNPWQVAFCDEEISFCYYKLKNQEKAMEFAQKALDFAGLSGAPYRLIWANARMGLAKKLAGEYQLALDHFEISKKYLLNESKIYWPSLVKIERVIADVYEEEGRLEEAKECRRRLKTVEETVVPDPDL